jgi:hypothetical protein
MGFVDYIDLRLMQGLLLVNERLVFLLSVTAAEFGASALLFLLRPDSPLTRRYLELLAYLAAHAVPSLGIWALLVSLSAALMPRLWRHRQNRATKIALFARVGLLGLAIDLFGSLYLWVRAANDGIVEEGAPSGSILLRLGLYVLIFAAVVGLADQIAAWHTRRHPPATTPPPRFGRA